MSKKPSGAGSLVKIVAPPLSAMLVGERSGMVRPRRNRSAELAMLLEIERLRLEEVRLRAEDREKDRELARFRIEQRRRLKEEVDERARREREDAEAAAELAEAANRMRERLASSPLSDTESEPFEVDSAPPAPAGLTEREKRIAMEVDALFAGTWKPAAPKDGG